MPATDRILFYVFGRNNPRVVRAEKYYYYDSNNKRYLDATSGAYNCILGHTVPERIAGVLRSHAQDLNFATLAYFQNDAADRLANRLIELMPDYVATGFYQSGSDAVEAGLRCALLIGAMREDRPRYKIIGRRGDYHGPTLGSMAVGSRTVHKESFPNFLHIEHQDCLNCPYGMQYPSCELRCASALKTLIEEEGPETIAAFIAVPSGRGGPVPDEYWPQIRNICEEYNILLVSDDVLEGMWRTGPAVALKRWGVVPDIVATGKVLGAGFMPIFATLVSDRVRESLSHVGASLNGHTFSGHILSCDIACAVLEEIDSRQLSSSGVEFVERRLRGALKHICDEIDDGQAAQIGALARLRIPCTEDANQQRFYLSTQRLLQACGVHAFITGTQRGMVEITIAPPFIADEEFFEELEVRICQFARALPVTTAT